MATAAQPTRDDFAALLEQSLGQNQSFEGRVVKGRVTAIDIDFGGRPDAAATLTEMKRFRATVIEKI